jgi:hypothetical protein
MLVTKSPTELSVVAGILSVLRPQARSRVCALNR